MPVWSLWKSRNTKLWEATYTSPIVIVSQAKDIIHECGYMQIGKVLVRSEYMEQPWTKPPPEMIKCNIDASSLSDNSI